MRKWIATTIIAAALLISPFQASANSGDQALKPSMKQDVRQAYKINVSRLVSTAKKYKGVRYKWGGMSPSGFDCSGYINYVFRKSQGITLPRTAADLYARAGKKVSKPSKGDLVFFTTYKKGASHVGIYIGNGEFIHASSVRGVTITKLNKPYYKSRYLGAKSL
ncbi:C40 family peptidase [Peribacillus glennii]|uniref:NlpC/P60 family protein n=1 Tax=Peribacillus glennii TaxID=2303991 RepID=A0A372LDG7_9BACI|nr:C40 family peptidase [Peribacillus glennii]RFU63981.1 NlpC/P60 family protein [Peribacillus glennii]